jgi:hypothetical protein
VREDMYLCVVPVDQLSVIPDLLSLIQVNSLFGKFARLRYRLYLDSARCGLKC